MSFDSPLFLSVFLPVSVVLHSLIPNLRVRNALLLGAGLLFYSFGSLSGTLLLAVFVLVNYLWGLLLRKYAGSRLLLAVGVAGNLLFLAGYKYLAFFTGEVLGLPDSAAGSRLVPLGISFFVFKCISYLVDTARSGSCGAKRYCDLLLYVSFFPQILAGPLCRFPDFSEQLKTRTVTAEGMAQGFRRFVFGFGKKLLLAYPLSRVSDGVFGFAGTLSAPLAWTGALCYMLLIYLDFSSYSDMAIGLGELFGFRSPENFRAPYAAVSLSDFWRRWHISLSQWFRDYLYIPLGGSRRGKPRAAINKVIVFTLCGFWHGAAWTFLLWGLWHGLFTALETLEVIPVKRLSHSAAGSVVLRVYTLLVVCLGFVLFRAPDPGAAVGFFAAMLGGTGTPAAQVALRNLFGLREMTAVSLGILCSLPLRDRFDCWERETTWVTPVSYGAALLLLAVSLCAMAAVGFRPFIYAQF